MKEPSGPSFFECLHIFTLCGFALSQPIFDILSQNPEFLVAHEATLADLFISILLPLMMAPLGVILIEKLAGLVSGTLRRKVHLLAVFCLLAATLNPPLKALPDSLDGLRALGALLLSAAITLAYARRQSIRTFFTFMSPSILLFPVIFVAHSQIWDAVWHATSASSAQSQNARNVPVKSDVPVVILVFDELPLTSLLDEEGNIDAARYPNFAALARGSTWYRNATTVSDNSTFAIPALLSGKYPDPEKIPIERHYPDTIFSLLRRSHRIEAFESATLLYREDKHGNKQISEGPWPRRASLFFDMAVIYLRIVLPAKAAKRLPQVSNTWEGFGDPHKWLFDRWLGELSSDRLENLEGFLGATQGDRESPGLFFVHLLLPHSPFEFFPDGKRYDLPGNLIEVPERIWESREQVLLSYYRHLLQLGFVDQILGTVIDRLKKSDLYDRSLVCLVSDHGISFKVNGSPRRISPTNAADILSVPLFIKAPGQMEGRIDESPVKLIDILPTLAESLQVQIPWVTDGTAASRLPRAEGPERRVLQAVDRSWVSVTVDQQAKDLSLRKKIEWFGSGADKNRIFLPRVKTSKIDQLIRELRKSYPKAVL